MSRISPQPLNPEFYSGVEIYIKFPLVALKEPGCEGTKFLLALAAKPLLIAVELWLLIRTVVAQGADTELDLKQHNHIFYSQCIYSDTQVNSTWNAILVTDVFLNTQDEDRQPSPTLANTCDICVIYRGSNIENL